MPLSATADGRRVGAFTRQDAIECLQEYARLYGREFTAAAFNPATARWQRRPEYIERYERGRPDGRAWMSLNAIKKLFPTEAKPGGSWDEARRCAGLPVNSTGPRPHRAEIPDELPTPVRKQVVIRDGEKTRKLVAEVARLRAQLERAEERAERQRLALQARPEPKVIERTVTVGKADDRAFALLQTMLDETCDQRDDLLATEVKLRRDVEVLQGSLEAAQRELADQDAGFSDQTKLVASLRAEQAEKREALDAALARAETDELTIRQLMATAEQLSAECHDREDQMSMLRADLDQARAEGHEAAQRAARDSMVAQAQSRADEAEKAAQRALRVAAEHAQAATGELRVLTPTELRELRVKGPSGPGLFKDAMLRVARAQATRPGDLPAAIDHALRVLATWKASL